MNKRIFGVILSLLLVLSCCSFVFAQGEDYMYYVTDQAGLLSEAEWNKLEDKANKLSEELNVGIYIVTVQNMTEYGYYDIEQFTQDLYEANDCGLGDDRDGIMLCLSMNNRDYDIDAHGHFSNYAFTDYGKEKLAGTFLDDFRTNKWYEGFDDFLDKCESMIVQAAQGNPVDVPGSEPKTTGEKAGISAGAGGVIASIVAFIRGLALKGSMKSAHEATSAGGYLSGNVHFTNMDNILINRDIVRRPAPAPVRVGGGGGGGTTINSAGHSHHSGKF